jgi:hypothetical protein
MIRVAVTGGMGCGLFLKKRFADSGGDSAFSREMPTWALSFIMKPYLAASLLAFSCLTLMAQSQSVRVWTNQEGRTLKASLVEVSGTSVVLLLENGTKSTVNLRALSAADQDYVKKLSAGGKPASSGAAAASVPGALTWPEGSLELDPKTIAVVEGVQDAKVRKYHYQCGMFEFISSAPLAKSVMSEVAADFLLTHKAVTMMSWGWEPKPKEGTHFKIMLAETKDDYVNLFGGNDVTVSTMVNGDSLIMFSALGLKKVGARYQYDARQKDPGGVTFITIYGMLYEIRGWLSPWTRYAYPYILSRYAYQDNGSIKFQGLESAFKKYYKQQTEEYKLQPDLARMLKTLRARDSDVRTDARILNQQLHLDSAMLGYYFGYLDGDGSGKALHEYYRNVMIRARKSTATIEPGMEKASPEEMLSKLIGGRTDEQLGAEMTEKFRTVGVKFGK